MSKAAKNAPGKRIKGGKGIDPLTSKELDIIAGLSKGKKGRSVGHNLQVKLNHDIYVSLYKISKMMEMKISDLINIAVKEYVENHDDVIKGFDLGQLQLKLDLLLKEKK